MKQSVMSFKMYMKNYKKVRFILKFSKIFDSLVEKLKEYLALLDERISEPFSTFLEELEKKIEEIGIIYFRFKMDNI